MRYSAPSSARSPDSVSWQVAPRYAAAGSRRTRPLRPVLFDDEHRERCGATDDHDRIAAAALAGHSKAAAGQRVVDSIGQRALADDGELGGGRQRAADQRAEGEDQRRLQGASGSTSAAPSSSSSRDAKTAAAEELTERRVSQHGTRVANPVDTSMRR